MQAVHRVGRACLSSPSTANDFELDDTPADAFVNILIIINYNHVLAADEILQRCIVGESTRSSIDLFVNQPIVFSK